MILQVENLRKSFGKILVLSNISFFMKAGETLALQGESGSGKSTLLHAVGGLEPIDGGQIIVDGTDLTTLDDAGRAALRRDTVGVVFQQFNLIPSLSVGANIAFQARLGRHHDPNWINYLSDRLGLAAHLSKYPEALSGGQQQRVAIARTLAARPKLILADEPTGNLDEDNADVVLGLLLDCAREAGAAVLMVTHSTRQAARMRRCLTLSRGQITTESSQ